MILLNNLPLDKISSFSSNVFKVNHYQLPNIMRQSETEVHRKIIRLYNTVINKVGNCSILKNSKTALIKTVLENNNFFCLSSRYRPDRKYMFALLLAKPWWDNAFWFYLSVVAFACIVVYFVCHHQLLNFKQKYSTLQLQIKVLTTETNKAIEHLRQSEIALLENNEVKNQVITMVLHDLRSPIRSISTISSYLADKRCCIAESNFNDTLLQLKLGSRSLENFTEKFFLWADSQRDNFKIQLRYFALDAFLLEIINLYQDIAKINENKIMVLPTCLFCFSDYQLLACVIRNLVDNANKYTFHGMITLSASTENNELILNVSDTGKGLTPIQINDFLTGNKHEITSGTGSILILTMLKKIEGRLQIQSMPEKGSTFSIRLKNSHPSQTSL